ncbi:uncharacterized protein [Spinacia oleracea]|uniref:DUF4283 domain-containing protein n=1 Tax=Spinacia oleracea TaxID=3562 RepID=A0A9R0J9V9_SPIOL|nr:uncharacterized protein LOC110802761 [Spinacia oleracea]
MSDKSADVPLNVDSMIHVSPNSVRMPDFHRPRVKITQDDICDEIQFWESSVVCFVLGENPPSHVIEGFVRRIWGKMGVDKVAALGNGVHIVRFTTLENRDKVLNLGYQYFNKKPFIVKPWEKTMSINKDEIRSVPIWIQFPQLNFMYWGEKSLYKIAGMVGNPVKMDQATKRREKLQYARVLVEVCLSQELPETVEYENVDGEMVSQKVVYG